MFTQKTHSRHMHQNSFFIQEQFMKKKYRVSMGSSLGLAMTNISMTRLESKIIKPLMNKNSARKIYCRYSDDKLLTVKP